MTLADLQAKASPEHFARPQRIEFCLLILFTAGHGEHHVDIISYPVRERTLIFVQPKQVQQFHFNPSLKGRLLLIDLILLGSTPQNDPKQSS